ncbi:MAG: hypothetical protein HY528_01520 [Chloroflexi bacterium]|nr:hypothetical protein [Chloroflexota bacterium]
MLAGILTLGQASVVLAHEGESHLTEGFVLTPLTIAIFGGTAAALFLTGFLLWFWASRSLKRKGERERRLHSSSSKVITSESDDIKQEA